MKLATWNVNSIRARLSHVLDWLGRVQPDVLCLQETKVADADFPLEPLRAAGYFVYHIGQKGYNGVATLTRVSASNVVTGLPGLDVTQKRTLALTVDGVRVINIYVPNGEAVGSKKYTFKLSWMKSLIVSVAQELIAHPLLTVVGDFNVAPDDRDVHNPMLWRNKILFSEPERTVFNALLDVGLKDVFRCFDQPSGLYTWWDYRGGAFRRNFGLRIDHILASSILAQRCTVCTIDRDPRAWEKPSDHAPVVCDFALN